jgi:hypothetical protein
MVYGNRCGGGKVDSAVAGLLGTCFVTSSRIINMILIGAQLLIRVAIWIFNHAIEKYRGTWPYTSPLICIHVFPHSSLGAIEAVRDVNLHQSCNDRWYGYGRGLGSLKNGQV